MAEGKKHSFCCGESAGDIEERTKLRSNDEYKKLSERNPKDLSLLERLGHLAMLLDKKDEAVEYYSKILESDATNTLCYEQLMDI